MLFPIQRARGDWEGDSRWSLAPRAGAFGVNCCRHPGGRRVWGRAQARVYLQWWARSGLMLQHLGHLYTTWPGFSCKLSMNSLVAFPLGTAPCEEEERCQGRAGAPSVRTVHSGQSFENCNYTHGMAGQDMSIPTTLASAFRIVPTPMNSY